MFYTRISTHESFEWYKWYTPPEIFKSLDTVFDLDPCSAGFDNDFVPSINKHTINDDGIHKEWNGLFFMNPPHGKYTNSWMDKLAKHNNGIALVFSRTDTAWFQKLALPGE